MTPAQIKALFDMLQYTARMVVELRADQQQLHKDFVRLRETKRQSIVNLRASNARLRAETHRQAVEIRQLHKLLNDKI